MFSFITIFLFKISPIHGEFQQANHFSAATNRAVYQQRKVTQVALILAPQSIRDVAKQVTVRILNGDNAGSGTIISRQKDTYTVLTCAHVVEKIERKHKILTSDGATYPAIIQRSERFGSMDVAFVQFKSANSYRTSILGDVNNLAAGSEIYASGYPNYQFPNNSEIQSTYSWGTNAFLMTTGKVGLIAQKSLAGGYSLGYTNAVFGGMSGGPILDKKGRLVGINGRLQYPLQGINAFIFEDGTQPSESLFGKMEALSWGIPINGILRSLKYSKQAL